MQGCGIANAAEFECEASIGPDFHAGPENRNPALVSLLPYRFPPFSSS